MSRPNSFLAHRSAFSVMRSQFKRLREEAMSKGKGGSSAATPAGFGLVVEDLTQVEAALSHQFIETAFPQAPIERTDHKGPMQIVYNLHACAN